LNEPTGLSVVTVGHSNGPRENFLELLRAADIDVLVDVRTSPFSRYAPQFNEREFRQAVEESGLRYVPMGEQLGGRPADPRLYDDEGHVVYARVARERFFLDGIERLKLGAVSHRIAVMCSEEDPIDCHRRLLIGRVLSAHGVRVLHLRGNGSLQTEDQIRAREESLYPDRSQLSMFSSEEDTWRSIRSVLPSGRPRTSSESSNEPGSDSW
jgi:uncharacterized protein (DUF488 family)